MEWQTIGRPYLDCSSGSTLFAYAIFFRKKIGPFLLPADKAKHCRISVKWCRSWSDVEFCAAWSGLHCLLRLVCLHTEAKYGKEIHYLEHSYRYSPPNTDFFFSYFSMTHYITKTCLYNVDPLKPQFYYYIAELGFTGVGYTLFFLFLLKNIHCGVGGGYPLELPHQGSSDEYPQSMFWAEIWKISEFLSEKFQFFGG